MFCSRRLSMLCDIGGRRLGHGCICRALDEYPTVYSLIFGS